MEDEAGQKASSKETVQDRDTQKRKKNKVNDEKRVGGPVIDLRQSLLSQADGQPPEDRQSKASTDKLDKTVSNPQEKSMSKESRDLESTGRRTHPREPRSDVGEGKQKSEQAAGSLIASRIEQDKSQVGFACVCRTGYRTLLSYRT
jgi:hypothetical protein